MNGFRHTKVDKIIVKGNQYRIKSVTSTVQKNLLIYTGRLEKKTTDDAVRAHIADVGKLKCRSEMSHLSVYLSVQKSLKVCYLTRKTGLSGARI